MMEVAKSSATTVSTLVLFLLQPVLAKRFALLFSCVKMGSNDEDLFFAEDLEVQCWGSTHQLYVVGFGLPFFVLYVVGVPLGVYRTLQSNHAKVMAIVQVALHSAVCLEKICRVLHS